MKYPEEYRYSKEHEWVRVENGEAVIGITHFAQDELGDVVFVELPEVGEVYEADDEIGTIESVKAVAEIYTPVGGEIVQLNDGIEETPELVNNDPHGEGWLVRIRMSDAAELERLMGVEQYAALVEESG